MPEETPRTLNHFGLHAFTPAYRSTCPADRPERGRAWLSGLLQATSSVQLYQPTESGLDVISWLALPVDEPAAPAKFFECFARANNAHRAYLTTVHALWGFT